MAKIDRTGIVPIHRKGCGKKGWERCSCTPPYRADVWDAVSQRRQYKTFPTHQAAANWRQDMQVALRNGQARVSEGITVARACEQVLEDIESGKLKADGGRPYKPSAARALEGKIRLFVKPKLGNAKLRDVQLHHVQTKLVDELVADGAAASSVRNTVTAFRVVCRWARRRGYMTADPCKDLELPSGEVARDRIVAPSAAAELLEALEDATLRAFYATAFFAGLRRGELLALRWEDVDLKERKIRVRRSYDPGADQFVEPKTKNGRRDVPFPKQLLAHLMEIRKPEGLVFPAVRGGMFTHAPKVAAKAWEDADVEPVGLHEARHTYASHMLAAGIDIVRVSKWMGHSTIQITVDRYGHLVPGDEAEILERYEAYLEA